MSDLDMDDALSPLDLSRVPSNFIHMILQSMSLSERFTCALVCKAWAEAATAATRSITLNDSVHDFSCFQRWLERHGGQVEVLQLHKCFREAVLTALPCPQLQDLLLHGHFELNIASRVWSDIAAATKLTSVFLEKVQTASQHADVVSALTALPDLEQLAWWGVKCGQTWVLTDSLLLHKLTKLTALKLGFDVAAEALEHLALLTRLQDLSLSATAAWAAAGCPGLQELKPLTRLELLHGFDDIPPSVSQLTALQRLHVPRATPTALNKLSVLTGLTCLCAEVLEVEMWPEAPPLQLPGLQHLKVEDGLYGTMPMSFLATCTQLRVLELCSIDLSSTGSLVASSMLEHLELCYCGVGLADSASEAVGPVSWQHVFPGPGRLPHLTSLKIMVPDPNLQHADIECVVACCSNLQVLDISTLPDSSILTLTNLSGLTSLRIVVVSRLQCSSLAQLTGLRDLRVHDASEVFAAGLRQLAALEQLTSLGFHSLGWSSDVLREHMSDTLPGSRLFEYEYVTTNKAPAGQPPDVCARLRRACDMATAADS